MRAALNGTGAAPKTSSPTERSICSKMSENIWNVNANRNASSAKAEKTTSLKGETIMEATDKFVKSNIVMMSIDELKVDQPFCDVFDIKESDLQQVIDAIKEKGFDTLYPIVVWDGHDNVVVDGHTRLAAAKQLGYTTVPVVPRSFADEEEALQHTISAQRVRRSLSQAELMKCVSLMQEKLAERKKEESVKGLTHTPQGRTTQIIADTIGSTRGTVDKIARIARHGDSDLIEAVQNEEMSINQAHEIIKSDERKKKALERVGKFFENYNPDLRDRFFRLRDFADRISKLYGEFLKTYHDEFRDREMCSFEWCDLRQLLVRGLDRDLICHLGKPGEADRAINCTGSEEDFEEDLKYLFEEHQEEWKAMQAREKQSENNL